MIKKSILLLIIFIISLNSCMYTKKTQFQMIQESIPTSSEHMHTKTDEGELLIVTFIDVGQGDSIFIEFPNGKTMLIDSGERSRYSDVEKVIEKSTAEGIDALIATHPHSDHIGGMAQIIQNFHIGKLYLSTVLNDTQDFKNMLNALSTNCIETVYAAEEMLVKLDDTAEVKIISPNIQQNENMNNSSIVIRLVYYEAEFLFMGDAERQAENRLLTNAANITADVIKIGHHGSDTSTSASFIEKVSPMYAIISCGANNQYGHPSSSVLKCLLSYNIQIYRTDLCGDITISTNGYEIEVTTEMLNTIAGEMPTAEVITDVMVYITKTGKKYHKEDCQYIRNGAKAIALSEAEKLYQPCTKCRPP